MESIKRRVHSENLLCSTPHATTWLVTECLLWNALSIYLTVNKQYFYLSAILFGFTHGRNGFTMHAAGHNELYLGNTAFGYLFMTIFGGISFAWWKDRHNKHHQNTNVVTKDPDLKTYPYIIYNKAFPSKAITRYQRLLLPVYLCFYIWIWSVASLVKTIQKKRVLDLFLLGCHIVLQTQIYQLYLWREIIVHLFISKSITGFYLGIIFMLNHFTEDYFESRDMPLLEHTLATTRNIKGGPLWTWFSGGLDYQIEHHLFTKCPMENLRRVSEIVKEECNNHGLVYKEYGICETFATLWTKLRENEVNVFDSFE